MAPPHKRTATAGFRGGSGKVEAACVDASRDIEANSKNQLLASLDDARKRCEANQQIAEWLIELQARVWRAEAHLLHDNCRAQHATLDREIERLRLCISLAKKAREP